MTAVASPPPAEAPPSPPPPASSVAAPAAGRGRTLSRWLPAADEWLDLVALAALCVAAVSAFGDVYGGTSYLVAGGIGVLTGLVTAFVAQRLRLGLLLTVLLGFVVYLLVGSAVVAGDDAIAWVIPTPDSLAALLDGTIRGWKNLLTTLPPVGGAANLFAIPFACGMVAGLVSLSVSRRTPVATLAIAVPLAVVTVAILTGTDEPVWSPAGSAAFAAACVLWGSFRQRTARVSGVPPSRSFRLLGTLATLLAAGVVGMVLVQETPIAGDASRYVLRDQMEPPLDLREYPSPLSGFRRYLDADRSDTVLFTVDGLPPGGLVRIATLDRYDGRVWRVAGGEGEGASSGYFQRVGDAIPGAPTGETATVELEVVDYRELWVPTVGAARTASFAGPRSGDLAEAFRYNLATGSAVVVGGLRPDDRLQAEVVVPPARPDDLAGLTSRAEVQPALEGVPEIVGQQAVAWSAAEPTDGARVAALERHLREEGYYSDGAEGQTASRAGHSADRMVALLEQEEVMVGNAEQYASALALMVRDRGIPARVVMGFAPAVGGEGPVEVRGSDVTAWVEVALGASGWIPLQPTPPKERELTNEAPEQLLLPDVVTPPRPPATTPERPPERADDELLPGAEDDDADGPILEVPTPVLVAAGVVLVPTVLFGAVVGLMAGLKGRRRKRRQRTGSPSTRIAAGWSELTDLARDVGDVVPDRATRRETALLLGRPGAMQLAEKADERVFGPGELSDADVTAFWSDVEVARQAMLEPLGIVARVRAVLNPTSLKGSRRSSPPVAARRPSIRRSGTGRARPRLQGAS